MDGEQEKLKREPKRVIDVVVGIAISSVVMVTFSVALLGLKVAKLFYNRH